MPAEPKVASGWLFKPRQLGRPGLRKLKTRAQFEAALKSQVVAKSEHFALHRLPRHADPELDPVLPSSLRQGAAQEHGQNPKGLGLSAHIVNKPTGPSFAVLVPKRWASRAVTRNMIKRQARAMAQCVLPGQDDAIFLLRLRRAWPHQNFISASSLAWSGEVRAQLTLLFSSLEPQPR